MKPFFDIPRFLRPGTELKILLSWLKTEAAKVRVKEVTGDASYTTAADRQTRLLQSSACGLAASEPNHAG